MDEERMKARLAFATFLFMVSFCGVCLANPVVVFQFPSFGGEFGPGVGHALIIDCAADFIVLLLGYLIIKNIRVLTSLKFLPYFGVVFIGGIIIDFVSPFPVAISFFLPPYGDSLDKLGVFICAGLLLYFYNGFVSKKFFKLESNQARVIGIVMAILTNPLVGQLFVNSFQRWQ
jgi:hypothetical protein